MAARIVCDQDVHSYYLLLGYLLVYLVFKMANRIVFLRWQLAFVVITIVTRIL